MNQCSFPYNPLSDITKSSAQMVVQEILNVTGFSDLVTHRYTRCQLYRLFPCLKKKKLPLILFILYFPALSWLHTSCRHSSQLLLTDSLMQTSRVFSDPLQRSRGNRSKLILREEKNQKTFLSSHPHS